MGVTGVCVCVCVGGGGGGGGNSSELQTKSQVSAVLGGGGEWRLWLCCCCYWPFGQSISQVCCFLRNTTTSKVSLASNKSRHGSQKVLPSCLIVRRWGLPSCHFAKVVLLTFFWVASGIWYRAEPFYFSYHSSIRWRTHFFVCSCAFWFYLLFHAYTMYVINKGLQLLIIGFYG